MQILNISQSEVNMYLHWFSARVKIPKMIKLFLRMLSATIQVIMVPWKLPLNWPRRVQLDLTTTADAQMPFFTQICVKKSRLYNPSSWTKCTLWLRWHFVLLIAGLTFVILMLTRQRTDPIASCGQLKICIHVFAQKIAKKIKASLLLFVSILEKDSKIGRSRKASKYGLIHWFQQESKSEWCFLQLGFCYLGHIQTKSPYDSSFTLLARYS